MVAAHEAEVSERVALWRGWLIALGVVLLAVGGFAFLMQVDPSTYVGVAAWMAGAIIVHDGIGAMAVFGATVLLRRIDRRIPFAVLAIAQGAAVVGIIVTVLVIPEIVKQAIGTANPSILPLDYVGNLVLFSVGLAVATSVAVIVAIVLTRPRRSLEGRGAGARRR